MKRLIALLAALLLLSAALVSLMQERWAASAATQTPAPADCAVTFLTVEGETVRRVSAGSTLRLEAPEAPEHYTFLGWKDESGRLELREEITVYADRFFAASYAVALKTDEHPAYLFPEGGLARPDEPMTRRAAAEMFYELLDAPVTATERFLDVDETDACFAGACALKTLRVVSGSRFYPEETLTRGELMGMLSAFYPPCTQDCAFTDLTRDDPLYPAFCLAAERGWIDADGEPAQAEPDRLLSRLETARIMNRVLGRGTNSRFAPELTAQIRDMPRDGADYVTMAEALIGHRFVREDGAERWAQSEPLQLQEDGLVLIGTELYYVQNGAFLRDGEAEGLSFGPSGRYTSGSDELDELVQAVLREVLTDDMDAEQRLRAVYDYTVNHFTYRKKDIYPRRDVSWEKEVALDMFQTGRGNCYHFAAALYELTRAIGYDAQIFSGQYPDIDEEGFRPHSWIEIRLDDVVYVFDAEMEYAAIQSGEPKSFFMVSPEVAAHRGYRK